MARDSDEFKWTPTACSLALLLLFVPQLGLGDYFLLDVAGHDFVAAEFHRVAALAAGHAGEGARVGGDVAQGDFGFDRLQVAAGGVPSGTCGRAIA